jgi:hypothetical protein
MVAGFQLPVYTCQIPSYPEQREIVQSNLPMTMSAPAAPIGQNYKFLFKG